MSPGEVTWTPVACALCGADAPRPVLVDTVVRGGRRYPFQVVRCGACGFAYVSPRGSGALFDNLSGGAARRDAAVANAPIYAAGLRHLAAAGLRPGASVLDLGCARGDFLAYAEARGFQVLGVDINPGLAEAARQRGFRVLTADLRELALDPPVDAVTLWDVIEHVDDPVAVLAACRAVLRPGGLVLFHTGNARFQLPKARLLGRLRPQAGPYLIPYQHVSHFDPASAAQAFAAAGLAPVEVFFAGTLHYRQAWKRLAMGSLNAAGALVGRLGGPLLTNAMGAIGRRPG
jgi:2-polyprenyl-3-methyl-5-hydroxy-6-metoxy-1,4-benzoquinol methylase